MTLNSNKVIKDDTTLIETITEISKKVISKYVARSVIPLREKEDVEMVVVEKFMEQKDKINNAFKGKSKVITYYTAVVNRMCCEVIRKEQKHWYALPDNQPKDREVENSSTTLYETEKGVVISNEVERLKKAMLFFNGTIGKVNLFLKYYYDIPLNDSDLNKYSEEHKAFVRNILVNQKAVSKADKFDKLTQLVNRIEGKNVKNDAVRIWLNKQRDSLLKRLNYNNSSNYNDESLGLLIEASMIQNTNSN
ncbi:MAG: hypothetical protein ACLFT6_07900 [Bacteroidales bacterium]